jgi:hypothetical protein
LEKDFTDLRKVQENWRKILKEDIWNWKEN